MLRNERIAQVRAQTAHAQKSPVAGSREPRVLARGGAVLPPHETRAFAGAERWNGDC